MPVKIHGRRLQPCPDPCPLARVGPRTFPIQPGILAGALFMVLGYAESVRSAELSVYVTRPISDVMILPDTAPGDLPGMRSDTIAVSYTHLTLPTSDLV